ncbi:hypothetical protein ES708_23517 [subsurface metagenome]
MTQTILIDFLIPVILIGVTSYLLIQGIDGKVKTILTLAAGWAFRSSVVVTRTAKTKNKE